MLDDKGDVIYVGKAKNLKNRLSSYAKFDNLSTRIKMMASRICDIEVIVVSSENEALLLESNLIKKLKPFYNILLKDDKTFPYIVLDASHEFPRIFKHRTLKAKGANFFGPYPSVRALDETIKVIQKTFLLRGCSNSHFSNRQRPCLQYFIKRCSAPCVGKITKEEYARNLKLAEDLLNGKDETARKILVKQMKTAAEKKDFEQAAVIRDRLRAISEIQSKQYIQIDSLQPIDFIALARNNENAVVGVTFFRAGKNVGTETFVLENTSGSDDSDIIASFISQFYKKVPPPSVIATNRAIANSQELREELYETLGSNHKIIVAKQGVYKRIIASCLLNAQMKLKREDKNQFDAELAKLSNLVGLSAIKRMEIYDNSHIQGTNACGVMAVFENGAIQKNKARRFNISPEIANGGDDISMMKFSLEKRFKSKKIPEKPDLIIIDGGKTQLSAANEIVKNFKSFNNVKTLGIAKQNNRKVGDEKIILENGEEITLDKDDKLLSFLIMLRDEAHETAIRFHRKKRQKALSQSIIDDIPFVGVHRKRLLLEHFGSADFIKKASLDDLKMVKGINDKVAESVFRFFRNNNEDNKAV